MYKLNSKMLLIKMVRQLTVLLLITLLMSCNGVGSSNISADNQPLPQYQYVLGTVSGGAIVSTTSESYYLYPNQPEDGKVIISNNSQTSSGTFTMSVVPAESELINVIPESMRPSINLPNCSLISSNLAQQPCDFSISSTTSTINGDYKIIPVFAQWNSESQELNPIIVTVAKGTIPIPGNLTLTSETESILPGESTTATISLTGSLGTFESITVNITNSDPSVISVTPATCTVTSLASCKLSIIGITDGSSNLTISSSNHPSMERTFSVNSPKSYLYTANNDGTVSMFTINPNNGQLLPLNPKTVSSVEWGQHIVSDPMGRYVYVNDFNNSNIFMYRIESRTGLLSPLSPAFISITESNPNYMVIDPSGKYLYVTSGVESGLSISMFSIDQNSGILTPLNSPAILVDPTGSLNSIGVDPSGKHVYVINGTRNLVYIYNIESNSGILSPTTNPQTAPTGNLADGIAIDSTGSYTYIVNYIDRTISIYTINQSTGALISMGLPVYTGFGSGPIGITIDPTGQYLYTVNYVSNSISMFKRNQNTGLLNPSNPFTIPTGNTPYGIATDPTGKYLYVTNTYESSIFMYKLNQDNGILTLLNPYKITTGTGPFGVTIATPGGVAKENDHH